MIPGSAPASRRSSCCMTGARAWCCCRTSAAPRAGPTPGIRSGHWCAYWKSCSDFRSHSSPIRPAAMRCPRSGTCPGSAHRAHASTEAIAHRLKPAVAGLLMEKELRFLGEAVDHPARPFVAILGGAKISGKIDLVESLLPKVDRILIGGAMACTFFKAMGLETGTSLVEPDRVDMAKSLLQQAGDKLVLPSGAVI